MNRLLVLTSCVLTSALVLPSQTWTETGEAGDLPGTAQVPAGAGPLTQIDGNLDDPTIPEGGGNDRDMYLIHIDDPLTFDATTANGTTLDTQLFLFLPSGVGVSFNDDDETGVGGLRSRVTGQFVPAPGNYLLAVSRYDRDPTAAGDEIWADTPYNVERQPDGVNPTGAVDGWNGIATTSITGSYSIFLTGASFPVITTSCSDLSITGTGAPGTSLDFEVSGADARALAVLGIGMPGSSSFAVGPLGTLELGLAPGYMIRIMGITDGSGYCADSIWIPPGLHFSLDLSAQVATADFVHSPPGRPSLEFCTSDVEAFHVGN